MSISRKGLRFTFPGKRARKNPDSAPVPSPAQGAPTLTSMFSEPPALSGSCRLRCFVEGDSTPFTITVSVDIEVDDVKKLIHEQCQYGALRDADAKDLVLLRLKRPIVLKPSRTLDTRIQELDTESSEIAEELDEPTDLVSQSFPQQPPLENVHIIVKLGAVNMIDQRPFKRPRLSTPSPPSFVLPPSNSSPRSKTVSALYERLKKHHFILVRGTPASGKTTLSRLLAKHIHEQDPAVRIITVFAWNYKKNGGWLQYLQDKMGWKQGEKTIFIFDEAQSSYEDSNLWGQFFKNIADYGDQFAITFASYGSPISSSVGPGPPNSLTSISSVAMQGIPTTPFIVGDSQRVTLRVIDHSDGVEPIGLLFTRAEFDDLVRERFSSPEYLFHQSFFDGVFDLTGGHVGAIHDFVQIITAHDSYRQLRHTAGKLYTWDRFLAKVNLRDLLKLFEATASVFMRGLPRNIYLQKLPIARIFSNVLREGSMTVELESATGHQHGQESQLQVEDERALRRCFYNGWLHADKLSNNDSEETVYVFPSPLHRWFVEWKLCNPGPEIPFEPSNLQLAHNTALEPSSIRQLVLDVIIRFSPRLLSAERRIGPGCIQRPPEAQYQDEFYRCCHAYSNGSLITFPEFGTGKGRVDFYIPSRQWGVELLRDGDRLKQHSGRFSQSGSYGTTLLFSDYIILDCRNTWPKNPHHDLPKLYHVVFSNGYQEVSILDHLLQPVHGGTRKLLASS